MISFSVITQILREWKRHYVSLLTDFNLLEHDKIIEKRDELQKRTAIIYEDAPRTDHRAYKEAQNALKIEEIQKFSDNEIDEMLPPYLRIKKE